MIRAWRIWAHAVGPKPPGLTDREADIACAIRTLIYAVPGICIIANTGRNFNVW